MKYLLFFMLPLLFMNCRNSNTASDQTGDTLSADSVISKSEQSYATLTTYMDSGKVISDFYSGDHPHKSAKIFKTAYSKTEGFNFEYYEPNRSNSLYTINKKGNSVKTWWGITNKLTSDKSFHMAIGAASGVSSGTSTLVPRLLFANELSRDRNVYHSFTPVLNGTEVVNGLPCYKITGKDRLENKITVWVAKQDFLIRKVETDKTIDSGSFHNADSLMRSKFKSDSLRIRQLLAVNMDPQKKKALQNKLERVASMQKRILEQISSVPGTTGFSVKTTIQIYPYTPKALDKELFSFRPNREVQL